MNHLNDPFKPDFMLLRRVAVKFLDDFNRDDQFQLPYVDGAERCLPDDLKEVWDPLTNRYPGITLKRVYTTVSPKRIRQMVAEAQRRDKEYQAPNFLTFFAIDTPSLDAAEAIAKYLSNWQGVVEYVYVQPLANLAVSPVIEDPSQQYIDVAVPFTSPTTAVSTTDPEPSQNPGVNALNVPGWTTPGSDPWASGDGIQFVDIEKGWDLNHPSLLAGGVPKISVPPDPNLMNNVNLSPDPDPPDPDIPYANGAHGTNVLGILAANEKTDPLSDWKGLAERAVGYVISICWTSQNPSGIVQNIENAIMAAANILQAGDVLLLELEITVKGFGDSPVPPELPVHWPVECSANVFPPIRLATALGITVVEAAGNSHQDFDDLNSSPFKVDPSNDPKYDLNPNFNKDSMAIIVGAVTVTDNDASVRGHRSQSSNYGSRVNCFAWGDTVFTLYVSPSKGGDHGITSNFSGTSAASAIIAGAAIILQAFAKHPNGVNGVPLSVQQVRNILSDPATATLTEGAPQDNPTVEKIGVMPDLANIINNVLNLIADIVIRDNIDDNGSPHTDEVSSPDIIICPAGSVTDPQWEFGRAEAFSNDNLSTAVEAGDQDIFIRVLNRGGGNGSNAIATVYCYPKATFLPPEDWTVIGISAAAPTVPSNTSDPMTVLPKISWTTNEPPDNYCFVATVGCTEDPNLFDPATLGGTLSWDEFLAILQSDNNISWRNGLVEAE